MSPFLRALLAFALVYLYASMFMDALVQEGVMTNGLGEALTSISATICAIVAYKAKAK